MTDPKLARDTENGRRRGRPPGPAVAIDVRFQRFTEAQSNGCLRWTGKRGEDGYGRFSIRSRWLRAHRVAHELFIGPIPQGFDVDHVCHNRDADCPGGISCEHRLCVNPAHLEATTHQENLHRNAYIGDKVRQTHCGKDHEFTEANTARDRRGNRRCRACDRDAKARLRAARKATS